MSWFTAQLKRVVPDINKNLTAGINNAAGYTGEFILLILQVYGEGETLINSDRIYLLKMRVVYGGKVVDSFTL
jgi:hypothetical protein